MPDSLEQTLIKLRERNAFLERANMKLSEDWRRMRDQFEEIEKMIGGTGGLSLAGAVASRLAKEERTRVKITEQRASKRFRRPDLMRQDYKADTGAISDEVMEEILSR